MMAITLEYGKGYAGKMGSKCWVAEISGSDRTGPFGLARTFLDPGKVEKEHFNRARTMVKFTYRLPIGLYEASEGGERYFFVVWASADGTFGWTRIREDRVKAMIALMDGGMSANDARRATRPAQQPQG